MANLQGQRDCKKYYIKWIKRITIALHTKIVAFSFNKQIYLQNVLSQCDPHWGLL